MHILSSFFSLLFLFCVQTKGNEETLNAELIISSLELQDDCENLANAMKSSLLSNSFLDKVPVENQHGNLLRSQSKFFKTFEDVPWDIQRNWTLLVKPGDTLLPEEDWNSLVTYNAGIDELTHTMTINCDNATRNCIYVKNRYENFLEDSKNETLLRKSWQTWQTLLTLKKQTYPKVLHLVNKAALLNDQDSAKSYWEMLVDQEDAYEKAEYLWGQVKPLYDKLHNFVRIRLFNLYNITNNSTTIPAYLLGSNFGYDWSYIADRILPQPQAHYDAELQLNQLSVKKIFEIAEGSIKQLSLPSLGKNFWSNSYFNMTVCENQILSFCSQEHSEIFTCDKMSWVTYLESFENAIEISLRNMDYRNLPRTNLRNSVIEEALISLGSTLAIKNLKINGILPTDVDKNTELLLLALRILPKIPFYLTVDKWRLELLKNGYSNFVEKWWEVRKSLHGVEGVFNNETDFLADSYVTSNRPYLSKFLGIFLQFQMLEYFGTNFRNPNESIASYMGKDENFVMMIREHSSKDWPTLIDNYFSISDILPHSLLSYFQPLEQYLDSAPVTQEKIITTTTKRTHKVKARKLELSTVPSVNKSHPFIHHTVGPEPHRHFHEDLQEGDNPAMEKISMYVGIGLLAGVVAVVVFAIASKKLAKRNRTNNRRFET